MLETDRWESIEAAVVERLGHDQFGVTPLGKEKKVLKSTFFRLLNSKLSLVGDGSEETLLAFVLFKSDGKGLLEATVRKTGGNALAFDELKAAFYTKLDENDPRLAIDEPPAVDGRRSQQRLTWRIERVDFMEGEIAALAQTILVNLKEFHAQVKRLNDRAKVADHNS